MKKYYCFVLFCLEEEWKQHTGVFLGPEHTGQCCWTRFCSNVSFGLLKRILFYFFFKPSVLTGLMAKEQETT